MSDENETYQHLINVSLLLAAIDMQPIYRAAKQLLVRWQTGHAILTCGNGGSAATASHFVCDLTKATRHADRRSVRALCLNDNMAALTAWSNDTTYHQALAEQLRSVGQPGDALVCISGSGNSPNILQAASVSKQAKILVIALTGSGGGQLAPMADIAIVVPSMDMAAIEDCHLAICHALTKNLAGRIAL